MRFKKTVVTLVTGALVLAPATNAFATDGEVESQTTDTQVTQAEVAPNEHAPSSAPADPGASAEQTVDSADSAKQTAPNSAALKAAPVKVSVKMTGSTKVGKVLSAKPTVKKPAALKTTVTYTWYANGKKVQSGTSAKYKVKAADRNKRIHVQASVAWVQSTAHLQRSETAKSAPTAKVTKQKAQVKAKVKIKGKAKIGKKLKAKATVKKPKGLKTKGTYTWYVSGKKVKTGKTLKVKSAYYKKKIKLVYKVTWKGDKTYDKGAKKASKKTSKVGFDKKRAAKMVKSALGQRGQNQDCTRLVERALRSGGVRAGDLGTQVGDYTKIGGKKVGYSSRKAGDLLLWPGQHVALYTGNGKAVHGGYGGGNTVLAAAQHNGQRPVVLRF